MSGGGESTTSGTPMGCGLEGCSIIPSLSATSRPIAERGPRPRHTPCDTGTAPPFTCWLRCSTTGRDVSRLPRPTAVVRPFQWGHDWVPSNGRSDAERPARAAGALRRAGALPTLTRSIRPRRRPPTTSARRDGTRTRAPDLPECAGHTASREQRGARTILPGARRRAGRAQPAGCARARAVEFRRGAGTWGWRGFSHGSA